MVDVAKMKAANAARWDKMHVMAARLPALHLVAVRLCAPSAKAMYLRIQAETGVPWFVVAVIHEREAGGPPHWDKHLGQGDPLAHKTIHEPAGRGPFLGDDAFYRGALDALHNCAPFAAKWKDWSIGGTLTILEDYNGIGYFLHGVPSAYVWSATDQYVSGKYVADHDYRPGVVDVQEGCAALIACMALVDKSVVLGGPVVVAVAPAPVAPLPPYKFPAPPDVAPIPAKPPASAWAEILTAVLSLFGKR